MEYPARPGMEESLLPKQTILLPNRTLIVNYPQLEIRRAISSPVTRRLWTHFLFIGTAWILESPPRGERKEEENIVKNGVLRVHWLCQGEVYWLLFLPTLAGIWQSTQSLGMDLDFVIFFNILGCDPGANPEINSAWRFVHYPSPTTWLLWTEILSQSWDSEHVAAAAILLGAPISMGMSLSLWLIGCQIHLVVGNYTFKLMTKNTM